MSDAHRISPAEAHAKMGEGYTYVDVRTEAEFEAGHPDGAVNVPFMLQGSAGMAPNPEFLDAMRGSFPKDSKLVLGCKAGNRSAKARAALLEAGYADVLDQRAGWEGPRDAFGQVTEAGWSKVGLPTSTGTPEGRSWGDVRSRASRA